MNTEKLILEIIELMKGVEGPLYFDTAISVKPTPHFHLCSIWAVWVDNKKVFLMVADQTWHQFEASDTNANMVGSSVVQRLKLLKMQQRA
jgi:hypothetical protein